MTKLKDMSDEDLFSEFDSAGIILSGFTEAKKIQGMASRAQMRYNEIAEEVMKRKLWKEYNER